MIAWSEAAPAIKSLLEGLAHTSAQKQLIAPSFKARWAGKKTGFINPKAKAELILRVRNVANIGDDERRIEEIEAQRREVLVGQRRVTIEVRVEHHRHGEEDDRWAWSMVGLIRTRLRRESSRAALRAVNLSVLEIGAALDVSYTYQEREINAALFELVLAGGFRDVNEDTTVEWFERALVTSHLAGPDGTELSEPPNYTDEPMGLP